MKTRKLEVKTHRPLGAAAACAVALALAACGGGGGGDEQAWGQAKVVFAAGGTGTSIDVQGRDFGIDRVRVAILGNGAGVRGLVADLQAEVAARQGRFPGVAFGIVPQRVPSVEYREGRSSDPGYAVVDVDPVTGAPRLPGLRYNDDMTPYNADLDFPEQRRSVVPRMLAGALEREAVALEWEVRTARLQQDRGDALAGRTEVLRAAAAGQLAPLLAGGAARDPGRFMPLALDLDGDGTVATVPDSASTRAVAWDGSGFQKQVGWVGAGDAVLFLDRNGDGQPDHGRELFSESLLQDSAKGAASLAWLDANGDGRITAADPVFAALRVWRDANADGIVDSGEAVGLAELAITALDCRAGRFVRNGASGAMANPLLEASAKGYRITVVAGGLSVLCSDGSGSVVVGVTSPKDVNLERLCK